MAGPDTPMMTCGHAANAVRVLNGVSRPACAICGTDSVLNVAPDLAGRIARCSSCGREAPSDKDKLAFFEYTGAGSRDTERCRVNVISERYPNGVTCGMMRSVHQAIVPGTGRPGIIEHAFEPRIPGEIDRYYCGCRGWD